MTAVFDRALIMEFLPNIPLIVILLIGLIVVMRSKLDIVGIKVVFGWSFALMLISLFIGFAYSVWRTSLLHSVVDGGAALALKVTLSIGIARIICITVAWVLILIAFVKIKKMK